LILAAAAPELGRVIDFQGSAVKVANAGDRAEAPFERPREPDRGGRGRSGEEGDREGGRFNNDLGNLFGEIWPLEALGVWPTGDFRVEPGDGAVPAIVFYAGAALAVLAVLFALRRWWRRGETAVPAALVAAIAVYAVAWAVGTPYTDAKAVMMIAPLAMLIAVRELAAPDVLTGRARSPRARVVAVLAAAFLVAAGGSSLVALGNAPVGPDEYSAGLARIRSIFESQPTLVLADPDELANENGRDFLAWEARGGDPVCIEPAPGTSPGPPPDGIRFVVTTRGETEPPFAGLRRRRQELPYTLWERRGPVGAPASDGPPGRPSECGLALGT
jgi:MYXO-CTERM domain-containing protein